MITYLKNGIDALDTTLVFAYENLLQKIFDTSL